jgi:hypothetical protein
VRPDFPARGDLQDLPSLGIDNQGVAVRQALPTQTNSASPRSG